MKTVDLYNEDGIVVCLDEYGDIVDADDPTADVRLIGHRLYACSLEQAQKLICREYLRDLNR